MCHTLHCCLIFSLALASTACHAEQPPPSPPPSSVTPPADLGAPDPDPPAEPSATLAWWRDAEGKPTTAWIERADTGFRELGRTPSILVRGASGTWRFETEQVRVQTAPCDEDTTMEKPPGDGTGTRATVRQLDSKRPVIVSEPEPGIANEFDHSAELVGSVGPYLFVRWRAWGFACGAHGNHSAGVTTWSVDRQAEVPLVNTKDQSSVPRVRERGRKQLLRVLAERQEDPPQEPADLVALLPSYAPNGELSLGYVFTTFVCYACGDGAWGSYTLHTVVDAEPPRALEPYATPPDELVAFLRSRNVTLGGWSSAPLETEAPEALQAAFSSGQ